MPASVPRLASVIAASALLVLAGCGSDREEVQPPATATESGGAHHFDVARVAGGLNRPVWVGAAPGDPEALWVLEQPGRVARLADGARKTLLDLSPQVLTGAEQGLLGI